MARATTIASTSEEGGRNTFSKREACTKPRLSQKKKKKKLTYIYGQNLATNLVIANDYNSY